jgi:hypothetical protein
MSTIDSCLSTSSSLSSILLHPTFRKLCVRHQRIADEGTNLKLQQVCYTLLSFSPLHTSLPLPDPVLPKVFTPFILLRVTQLPVTTSLAHRLYLRPRPSTTFPLRKGNPSLPYGQASRHLRILGESLFFGVS